MSDQSPNPADVDELQFDQAEYAEASETAGPACVACHQGISDQYYQLNGAILCDRCQAGVMEKISGGSFVFRFFKACLFGFVAAIGGFGIYFGVLKLTGMEIGLISILVGFMVGMAVRKGSEGRGGLLYQLTAIFFTYLAIAVSYSALLIPAAFEQLEAQKKADAQALPKVGAKAEVKEAVAEQPGKEAVAPEKLTPMAIVILLVTLFGVVLEIPIRVGFSQPIGLAIIAFALWEAFKLNRKIPIVITGPHNVGPGTVMAQAHV